MPAYVRRTVGDFIAADPEEVLGGLHRAYAQDGFASQYTRQTLAWANVLPKLQHAFTQVVDDRPSAGDWTILLEYPLYRLRRRIDLVVLAGPCIVVIECKIGASSFDAHDKRQVEEYALDLRDFHAGSRGRTILPVLWSTEAPDVRASVGEPILLDGAVGPVREVGIAGLRDYLVTLSPSSSGDDIVAKSWDQAAYQPVPTVIEVATTLFAGHDVRAITNADAENLRAAAACLVELILQAREYGRCYLLILTGVPGSGKTLAGLNVVHDAVASGAEQHGDIVYLSGNTPLVTVLREALARDEHARRKRAGSRKGFKEIRRDVRARIQHINDFLKGSLSAPPEAPPHEHVIVFDEAQRAWDEQQGMEKFGRTASESAILLDLMSRHKDWCACVCLVGGGQEINSGEEGVFGWGEALRTMPASKRHRWNVFASPDVVNGGHSAGSFNLGELPQEITLSIEPELQLRVPQRSFRSPAVSEWVDLVLSGKTRDASRVAGESEAYPIMITRSSQAAKAWLREHARGERRYGLLASSGARRLRADGLGVMLHAGAGDEIAHWYLNPPGDIRSSYALEVPANEYTCQGLELDFACLCWGGDLLWSDRANSWSFSRFSGTAWQRVKHQLRQRYLLNSYRVLLTRAREGVILWVPAGDPSDPTRHPAALDGTANFLVRCGAAPLTVDQAKIL